MVLYFCLALRNNIIINILTNTTMLAFIILLIIGFVFSSLMYGVFAKNATPSPMEHETELIIIGRKSKAKAA